MAKFKVYHIVRDGHVERDIIHADSAPQALAAAKRKYDDVIKVKRDTSLPLFCVLLSVVAIVVILFVVSQ